jgi:hypothetical protein
MSTAFDLLILLRVFYCFDGMKSPAILLFSLMIRARS